MKTRYNLTSISTVIFFFASRRRHTRCSRDWSSDVCFSVSSRRRHTRCSRDWSSDVCSSDLERIQGAIERYGEVFLRRIYTSKEREYCEQFKNKYERYAGRFAAKEAAMKALGTGWRRGVRWVDLEVVRESSGRPTLAITGEAAKIDHQLGGKSVALSTQQ